MRKFNAYLKSFILFLRPGIWMGFLSGPFQLISNTLGLSSWISKHGKETSFNDFYRPRRDYSKRYSLYEYVAETEMLEQASIDYLEFGVAKGSSFQWWINKNKNSNSRFYGFDTFEGLPEKWGTFAKGSMSFSVPEIQDERHEFHKGLFQQTLFNFLDSGALKSENRKIIHLDADLFSSTLFVLTSIHRHLKKGDILIFDEFNVPNHEYLAFDLYAKSFYVDYELIGAVNNYFQVAIRLK